MSTLIGSIPPPFIESRIYRALQSAYLGEANARKMYLSAAHRMERAQLHVIAHALRFTADQEKEHEAIFLGLLTSPGCARPAVSVEAPPLPDAPLDILHALVQAESAEAERLYPYNARIAAEEGYPRIAAAFRRIAETEALHARRFRQYESALKDGTLFREHATISWLCLYCSQLHTGCEPPLHCATCGKDRGHFIRSNHYPFAIEG